MKKIFLFIFIVISMAFKTEKKNENFTLIINVNELRNSNGVVQFSLYNKEGSMPDEKFSNYFLQKTSEIINNETSITFYNIPKGWYAINILHDENENEKIDKGFLLPKEGVGFSNYSSIGLTNRPKFEKAKFEISNNVNKNVVVIYF